MEVTRMVETKKERTDPDENRMQDYRQAHTDIHETEKEFRVSVELPGFSQDEIAMDITQERLEIRAERGDNRWYASVPLPPDADIGAIQATRIGNTFELSMPRTGTAE